MIELKNYSFNEVEKKWQTRWQQENIYRWNKDEPRSNTFVVDTPPPTVSGQLHIGHVYSYTQTDFIVRFKRMQGMNIFYPIGFDDNGLPTERLVEKKKAVRAIGMDRQEFVSICKEVVIDEEKKFRELFNQIALSVDWQLEYQTISPLSQKISQMSFLDLVKKGEVYRDTQPILWDPVDQTALAQADIEDKEKTTVMNDIIFHTEDGHPLIIATTRPELLPAVVAVFYHPDDKRYRHLKGKTAISPLFKDAVPILEDDIVQIDKGSGLVMCCTFGDVTDILWWRKHALPARIILNKQGRLDPMSFGDNCKDQATAQKFAAELQGLKVTEARQKICQMLQEQKLLIKQQEIIHTVKCAERSGAPLEIIMTPQWFIHTIKHKDMLLQRSNELQWHPKSMKTRLDSWINSIAWDWCITRQRYFGVAFPLWYSRRAGEEGKILFADISQLPVDPLKDLPKGYSKDEVEPETAVMDTWATSAVSPQLNTHAISEEFAADIDLHKKLFPFDLRPQGHEILRTWAFYTILKAHLHQNTLPWKNIMISGWCLAENRDKMSKSKGNIIEPEKLLTAYGSDVVRYWTSSAKLGADIIYSEDVMKNGKRLVNKLWNAAKFVSQHFAQIRLEDKVLKFSELELKITANFDRWLLNKLAELVKKSEIAWQNYEYADSMALVEKFFWATYCDNYLEITKIRTYNEDGSNNNGQYSAILTLYYSLQILLKLFAPFLPHITEELYHLLYEPESSIHARASWPQIEGLKADTDMTMSENLLEVLDLVRKTKANHNLSVKAPIELLEIKAAEFTANLLKDLQNVTASKAIRFVNELKTGEILEGRNVSIGVTF